MVKAIFTAVLIATGSPAVGPTVTTVTKEFTEGFNNLAYCRKLEASYHAGTVVTIEGQKISRISISNGTLETKTWCVEY